MPNAVLGEYGFWRPLLHCQGYAPVHFFLYSRTIAPLARGMPRYSRAIAPLARGMPRYARAIAPLERGMPQYSRAIAPLERGMPRSSGAMALEYWGMPRSSGAMALAYRGMPRASGAMALEYRGMPRASGAMVLEYKKKCTGAYPWQWSNGRQKPYSPSTALGMLGGWSNLQLYTLPQTSSYAANRWTAPLHS